MKIVQAFSNESVYIRLFSLSNLPGAAILNTCDVSWLSYCSRTNALCVRTIGHFRVQVCLLFKASLSAKFLL